MANLKGMKPLFKWNSKTPWTELQFSQSWWNLSEDSTLSQMFTKGFAKFMWFVILARVFGYCVKNYYMITRRAVKRTTIFAGKNADVSTRASANDANASLNAAATPNSCSQTDVRNNKIEVSFRIYLFSFLNGLCGQKLLLNIQNETML